MLNVYHFVYRQYGFHFRPSREDLIFWEWLGATNRLETYLKWKTANMLSRALGSSELVPCPLDLSHIPPHFDYYFGADRLGLLRTDQGFHRMKLHRKSTDRYASFCFSLYQSKAASLPAEEWRVRSEVVAAMRRLTEKPDPLVPKILTNGARLDYDLLEEAVHRTIELFSPCNRGDRLARRRLPSRGAVLGSSRSEGGALGQIARLGHGCDFFVPDRYLIGFYEGPAGAVEVRSSCEPEDVAWAYDFFGHWGMSHDVPCWPVGLPEPFKVRVITKGYAPSYNHARAYQPRLWRSLQEHNVFRLTGEMVTGSAIQSFLSECPVDSGAFFLSGDYKEATDHIPSEIANLMCMRFCDRLGIPLEVVGRIARALTGHILPTPELVDPTMGLGSQGCMVRRQKKGQLMGSPISFPFLCLYNLVLQILFHFVAEGEWIRDLSGVRNLINGDDLLSYLRERGLYRIWEEVVEWGGLKPSVGKTIVSQRYLTINSKLFRVDSAVDQHGTPYWRNRHLPHVQLQLAIGSMKSGHIDEDSWVLSSTSPRSRSRMWQEFLDSCPDKDRAWSFLFSANRGLLRGLMDKYPTCTLCLPTEAGGLGFPLPPIDSRWYVQRAPRSVDRMKARLLLSAGLPSHDQLRSRWLSSLASEDPRTADALLFGDLLRYQKSTGCPLVLETLDEQVGKEKDLPPPILACPLAGGVIDPLEEHLLLASQRRVIRDIDRAVRAYSRSGRGPWTQCEISDFLRRFAWRRKYGRYLDRTCGF
ncbi:RNA-dependent RNA polymerase [narna-like virus 6]|uniref:RNA-dependent RNA polymerase n=1 Tax=narna-like virus 6 TaxID=1923780 RepID=UPI00090B6AA5|nr:RNA-dependent RNA polymerase [narna-like virus 6]APG77204.1 RNA-dependent RNA polymerase [narna-like virus 6]